MKVNLSVNSKFTKAEVDDRLYSGFIEHIGRAVYTGIYEPEHPTADKDGFRGDVAGMVRELDMPLTRYPGGNFVSGFDWKDSIGPRDKRPVKADYAWEALEPNQVGVDEFVKWCRKAGTAPMMAVNLTTNTTKSAMELVEYCNTKSGTYWSDLRRKNGAEEPHNIKVWCLGNEVDGDWQIGHKTAGEYGRIAREAAAMMRLVDKNIELVACGTCVYGLPTYAAWDAEVLKECYDVVDYLSVHSYAAMGDNDIPDFMASPERMDLIIDGIISACDFVKAYKKSKKTIHLSVDEWNVWYHTLAQNNDANKWTCARPILEDVYTMADAIVVGGLLMSLLDHADRVKIACIAQTVNVIAPIMTRPGGGCWKQSIFYPLWYTSHYGRGTVLQTVGSSPEFTSKGVTARYVRTTAVLSRDGKEIALFAINRSGEEAVELEYALENFQPSGIAEAVDITAASLDDVNTETEEKVKPSAIPADRIALNGNTVKATLKPYSWNCIRIVLK